HVEPPEGDLGTTFKISGMVVDENHVGLEGFRVVLYESVGMEEKPIDETYTDEHGAFVFYWKPSYSGTYFFVVKAFNRDGVMTSRATGSFKVL
ncbi:MAG: hypothetical protein DRP02_11865, partial [Candidatus Gerdarchaeota archaeon]